MGGNLSTSVFQFGEKLKLLSLTVQMTERCYLRVGLSYMIGEAMCLVMTSGNFRMHYLFMPHCVVRLRMTLPVCVYHMYVPNTWWWPYGDRIGTGSSSTNELGTQSPTQAAWSFGYESSDSEAERPDPDLQLDDLASRRFHTSSVATPTNFALPMTSRESNTMPQTTRPKVMVTNVLQPTLTYLRSDTSQRLLCFSVT